MAMRDESKCMLRVAALVTRSVSEGRLDVHKDSQNPSLTRFFHEAT